MTYPGTKFRRLSMAFALMKKVLLEITNQELLLCSFCETPLAYICRVGIFGVKYSRYNIIHEVLWYEYIYHVAMNPIEDHSWAGDWIYANFRHPV